MIRWLLIPPFRGVLHGVQWAAYRAWKQWLHQTDPPPARLPLNQEDMEWIREQHRLTARPW